MDRRNRKTVRGRQTSSGGRRPRNRPLLSHKLVLIGGVAALLIVLIVVSALSRTNHHKAVPSKTTKTAGTKTQKQVKVIPPPPDATDSNRTVTVKWWSLQDWIKQLAAEKAQAQKAEANRPAVQPARVPKTKQDDHKATAPAKKAGAVAVKKSQPSHKRFKLDWHVTCPQHVKCPGTVRVTVLGTNRILKPGLVEAGMWVQMRAIPNSKGWFYGWTGSCGGSSPVCKRQMTKPRSVNAFFETRRNPAPVPKPAPVYQAPAVTAPAKAKPAATTAQPASPKTSTPAPLHLAPAKSSTTTQSKPAKPPKTTVTKPVQVVPPKNKPAITVHPKTPPAATKTHAAPKNKPVVKQRLLPPPPPLLTTPQVTTPANTTPASAPPVTDTPNPTTQGE